MSVKADPFLDDVLRGRRIVLGITGSIAAYKGLGVASALVQSGALVDGLLTRAAGELIRPLALQALTHRPVTHDLWSPTAGMAMDHIALARDADALLVAPATADTLARLALGRADDALATTALACRAPLLLAPAMEPLMWSHPATQENVATLLRRGATVIGPAEGRLASGKVGRGRMAPPDEIVNRLRAELGRSGPLAGKRIVISAGPTQEALDPVRFLSNHSSGRVGVALATKARDLGAEVVLVLGPSAVAAPHGVDLRPVITARQMKESVVQAVLEQGTDALIMAAAVADYRPAAPAPTKIKKADTSFSLVLERTDDVLLSIDAALPKDARLVRVGFAAETGDLESAARGKLERKSLDMVVANAVPASFGDGLVSALFVDADGAHMLPSMDKASLAGEILRDVYGRILARDEQ